jgi:DNA-directed RNA polymerase subunit beta'
MAEASIIAPKSAKEEHDAELARSPRDSGGTGDDALGEVVTSGTGTDADAGEYLNKPE